MGEKIPVYPICLGYRVKHEIYLWVGFGRPQAQAQLREVILRQLGRFLQHHVGDAGDRPDFLAVIKPLKQQQRSVGQGDPHIRLADLTGAQQADIGQQIKCKLEYTVTQRCPYLAHHKYLAAAVHGFQQDFLHTAVAFPATCAAVVYLQRVGIIVDVIVYPVVKCLRV